MTFELALYTFSGLNEQKSNTLLLVVVPLILLVTFERLKPQRSLHRFTYHEVDL